MKSYTDLEQSKRLSKILPIDTADMCFNDNEPCWSLAALLEIIPEVLVERRLPDAWDCVSYAECQMTSANNFENLIDACVELICQLKRKDLL